MHIIDGKQIASQILSELKTRPAIRKFFAGIVIGEDPASESFQKIKERAALELGVDYRITRLSADMGNDGLRKEIGRIAAQKTCGGVIVQYPIPAHLNKQYVANAIPPEKDPDVLSEKALGAFYADRGVALHPAAATVEAILSYLHYDLTAKKVAVVGAGFLIGKPVATWLMGRTPDLYVLSRGADFSILKNADLVIVGVGKAGVVTPGMLKDDAGVIDFGYSRNEKGDLVGDFDSSSLLSSNPDQRTPISFYTPTPGGTGPVLVASLFKNFYALNEEEK